MLKRKAHPDNPYSTFGRRTQALAPVSAAHRAGRAQQGRVYKALDAASSGCCFSCGRHAPLDHSHLLPQGMNKLERANPANLVLECRPCHDLWTFKLPEYARLFPDALARKADLIKKVNRQRWAFWMMKNEHLLNLK